MEQPEKKVIYIAPEPTAVIKAQKKRQLRVAAYCRVSTDDEEQLTSYEAQKTYYTDKIMTNPDWSMAGIFADEGITGTSARKRPEFLRMVKWCKAGKIDLILVKSISRFARNTVDCLNYIRILKNNKVSVFFEKENINTLETDSEMLITMMGAFAQAESESISANVRWGKRQAMKEGRVSVTAIYGYRKDENGQLVIEEEEAEIVRQIFTRYLSGDTVRKIREDLEKNQIAAPRGNEGWSVSAIQKMLKNEKYCGEVLLQKTFVVDCISKKTVKNTGQLPKYLIKNNHAPIVTEDVFQQVQTELARRAGMKASSKTASTGIARYSSKYALTERLYCGECGTNYKRCTWTQKGKKRIVWRCASRLDYGKKYCKHSPTLDEQPLQQAILNAANRLMSGKEKLMDSIVEAMNSEFNMTDAISITAIDHRLKELEEETGRLIRESGGDIAAYQDQFRAVMDEAAALKEKKAALQEAQKNEKERDCNMRLALEELEQTSAYMSEWDESTIRQLVEEAKVVDQHTIIVTFVGGESIEESVSEI